MIQYCMRVLAVDKWDLRTGSRVRHGNGEKKGWMSERNVKHLAVCDVELTCTVATAGLPQCL